MLKNKRILVVGAGFMVQLCLSIQQGALVTVIDEEVTLVEIAILPRPETNIIVHKYGYIYFTQIIMRFGPL